MFCLFMLFRLHYECDVKMIFNHRRIFSRIFMMSWTNFTTPNTTVTTSTEPHHVTKPNDYPVPVIITSTISCVLSIIGAVIIFGTYVRIPSIRNFTRRLIVCLTVADFLTCAGRPHLLHYLLLVLRNFYAGDSALLNTSVYCHAQLSGSVNL